MESLKSILNDPAFFLISMVALLGALGVILEKNIIRAGFSLIICFCAVAGVYFALQAPFVGASQVLIYAVGITLVIVFALMLTNTKKDFPKAKSELGKSAFSAAISIGIFLTFAFALTNNRWLELKEISCPRNTEIIGLKLLGTYALPFELISVLLLVALIGSVVIAKKDKHKEG